MQAAPRTVKNISEFIVLEKLLRVIPEDARAAAVLNLYRSGILNRDDSVQSRIAIGVLTSKNISPENLPARYALAIDLASRLGDVGKKTELYEEWAKEMKSTYRYREAADVLAHTDNKKGAIDCYVAAGDFASAAAMARANGLVEYSNAIFDRQVREFQVQKKFIEAGTLQMSRAKELFENINSLKAFIDVFSDKLNLTQVQSLHEKMASIKNSKDKDSEEDRLKLQKLLILAGNAFEFFGKASREDLQAKAYVLLLQEDNGRDLQAERHVAQVVNRLNEIYAKGLRSQGKYGSAGIFEMTFGSKVRAIADFITAGKLGEKYTGDNHGWFNEAALLCNGDHARALELRAKQYITEQKRIRSENKLHLKELIRCNSKDAAPLAEDLGYPRLARSIFLGNGQYADAARISGDLGQHDIAEQLFLAAGMPNSAAAEASARGDSKRAIELYTLSGVLSD
jgi:hypothetical protein